MKTRVKVVPRSSKEEIVKLGENFYKVYVRQPAIGGEANRKLVELLAGYFGTKKRSIRIISGLKSREKLVEVANGENRHNRRKRVI